MYTHCLAAESIVGLGASAQDDCSVLWLVLLVSVQVDLDLEDVCSLVAGDL